MASLYVAKVERVLGKPLPPGAVVHHVDEDRSNHSNTNLVVCEDRHYHTLLHVRTRALQACGNANWRKCPYCKEYDDPQGMRRLFDWRDAAYFHARCQKVYALGRKTRTARLEASYKEILRDMRNRYEQDLREKGAD